MIWLLNKLGFDTVTGAELWKRKWSTWLSAIQAQLGFVLFAWVAMGDLRSHVPEWVAAALAGGVLLTALVTPPAVNIMQKKLKKDADG